MPGRPAPETEEGHYNIYCRAEHPTFPHLLLATSRTVLAKVRMSISRPPNSPRWWRLPTVAEYMVYAKQIDSMSTEIYRYLNFDRMGEYTEPAGKVKIVVGQAQ